MLVLSRKKNETIEIGQNITLKVVAISGNRVRLAIDAPDSVRIYRGELTDTSPRRSSSGGAIHTVAMSAVR